MTQTMVPFVDMQARIEPLRADLTGAFERVLDSGVFVMGPESRALEEEFAAYCGVAHGVAVSNGTAALQLALLAMGIGPGDEVITVSHTFIATVEAIWSVGATPVLVDIESGTYLMDASLLEAAITPRTRAIIPVHLYGQLCDMDAINAIASKHRIPVVEDACQAHGATYRGRRAGSLAAAGCFSFYPAKNLGTIGEGGILVTDSADIAEQARLIRGHGEIERYHHSVRGLNLRMPELMAAAVRVQLPHLDAWNVARRQVAAWYIEALNGSPVATPAALPDRGHVYHLFVVETDARDALRALLTEKGVGTGVHYPVPVHRQPAFLDSRPPELSVTEAVTGRILSLPMYPELQRDQVQYVADALRSALPARGAALAEVP
jgi:dTDP-4-amino-4,6-dideoxygalactose transaminase